MTKPGKVDNKNIATFDKAQEYLEEIRALSIINEVIAENAKLLTPQMHGFPDLFSEELTTQKESESLEEFKGRQEQAIYDFTSENLFLVEDGKRNYIRLLPQAREMIADFFYGRVSAGILWKCCHPNNLVITTDGLKAIKDVIPGDRVINENGEIKEILRVGGRDFDGDLVSIKVGGFSDRLRFTPEHKVLVIRTKSCDNEKSSCTVCTELCPIDCGNKHYLSYSKEWLRADQVRKGDIVFLPRISKLSVNNDSLVLNKTSNQHSLEKDVIEFSPDFWRFLGYWMAEGDVHKNKGKRCEVRLTFNKDEIDYVSDIQDISENCLSRKVNIQHDSKCNTTKLYIYHTKLAQWLWDNCGKSDKKRLPFSLLSRASDEELRNYLRGLFRGDGHFDESSLRYVTISPQIASQVYYIGMRLGIPFSLSIQDSEKVKILGRMCARKKQYYFRVSGKYKAVVQEIVDGSSEYSTSIEVGNSLRRWSTEEYLASRVTDTASESYCGKTCDLEVEGEHESFCSPNIVVHNSRGGGGSTSAAVLIFMMMVYHKKEFTNLAGAGSQARSIYEKVTQFCLCNSGVAQYLIKGDPLLSRTEFYNGAKLHCINATDKQVRSRHDSGLIIDEGCLLPGSKVITERGIINVEDVVPGDRVVNQDGILTSVKNVWSKDWDNRVVNISLNGWSTGLELTHDHRVKIIRGLEKGNPKRKDSVNESNAEWVHAEDISDRDYVLIPKIKKCVSDECIIPDTYEGGKWLGYWLGDGWTSKQRSRGIYVVFNSKDECNVSEYTNLCESLFNRKTNLDNSDAINRINTDTVVFTHKELADYLDGTFGTKSIDKGIPFNFIATRSEDFVRGVISGLIASDGIVWEGKATSGGVCKRASIQTSSEALAASIFTCLSKLGVAASYRECPAKISNIRGKEYYTKESWVIDINGKAINLFADTDDSDRKQEAFNSWVELDNYIAVPVKSIESRDYSGEVWDIEVEDGESFMMMNAVVHNCQADLKAGIVMKTALQNALTQPNHLILVLSTFHHPEGFFQEYWDSAEKFGFKRYKWSIYDCVLPDTEVLTDRGTIPVQDVSVGDKVVNIDGDLSEVTEVFSKKSSEKRYRIEAYGYNGVNDFTGGHRVYALSDIDCKWRAHNHWNPDYRKDRSNCYNTGKLGWFRVDELKQNDFLAIPIPNRVESDGTHEIVLEDTRNRNASNPDRVDLVTVSMNKDFYLFLGMFLGDGCASRGDKGCVSLTLNDRDADWISLYSDLVKKLFNRKVTIDRCSEHGMRLRFRYPSLSNFLRKNYYKDGNKSTDFASLYSLDDESLINFVKGLIITDGSLSSRTSTDRDSIKFGNTSKEVVDSLWLSLLRLGIVAKKKEIRREVWEVSICGDNARHILSYIEGTDITRKRGFSRSFVKDGFIFLQIKDVVEIDYSGDVYDLTVDSKSSFVAGCTLAHNTMQKCVEPIDCKECYLTKEIKERDENGKVVGVRLGGCNGTARESEGFQEYDTVVKIKKANSGPGDTTFEIEYECERPKFYGCIYDPESINDAEWEDVELLDNVEMSVGLDWGYVGQTAVPIVGRSMLGIAVLECGWFHENQVVDIIGYLEGLKDKYGNFTIYADGSDPFNNRELIEAGFKVLPVAFKKWKDFGIKNLKKFFDTGRIQMKVGAPGMLELIGQLRKYRADDHGKPIKKDDHGPDALMCACLNFRFYELFGASSNLRQVHPEMYDEDNRKTSSIDEDNNSEEISVDEEVILF